MKNFIGGLFLSKEMTDEAYRALQEAGFDDENIMILERKGRPPRKVRESGFSKSVAITAFIGALIGTALAALFGYLVGQREILIPGFMLAPGFAEYEIGAFTLLLAQGAVTGAILGTAFRLVTSRKQPTFTRSGITRGGLTLAVNADENQHKYIRRAMEEAGAIDFVNLTEKWNLDVWTKFKKLQPPSAVS